MKNNSRLVSAIALFAAMTAAILSTSVFAAGGQPPDSRRKLVLLVAEKSYDTPTSLAEFSTRYLEEDFRVVWVRGSMAAGENAFDRMDEVTDADVVLVSVVRRAPPVAQLAVLRRYVAAGKPIVGIRTAGHAFALSPGQKPPDGGADWPTWDADVIGGSYSGHYRAGPNTSATITAVHPDHPVLRGVALPFQFTHQLYKVRPLRPTAEPLLTGTLPGEAPEPVAWTFIRNNGGRTFYTSLGTTADFKNPAFTHLLHNGILWAVGVPPRK